MAPIRVVGPCMEPTLSDGDEVWLLNSRRMLPGDLVLTQTLTGQKSVHRLLGVRPSRVGLVAITQADNSNEPDPALPLDRVFGRVDVSVSARQRVGAVHSYCLSLLGTLRRIASTKRER